MMTVGAGLTSTARSDVLASLQDDGDRYTGEDHDQKMVNHCPQSMRK